MKNHSKFFMKFEQNIFLKRYVIRGKKTEV